MEPKVLSSNLSGRATTPAALGRSLTYRMSTPEPPRRPQAPEQPPTEPLNPPASRQPRAPAEPVREYEQPPPEEPPRGPWWESPWPAILAAVVALLIGG